MAIKFLCPLGHRLKVHADLAGKAGHCPICRQRVFIPLVSASPRPRKRRPTADAAAADQAPLTESPGEDVVGAVLVAPAASPGLPADSEASLLPPVAATSPVDDVRPQPIIPPADWLADAPGVAPPLRALPAPPSETKRPAAANVDPAAEPALSGDWDAVSLELGLPPKLSRQDAHARGESGLQRRPLPPRAGEKRRPESPRPSERQTARGARPAVQPPRGAAPPRAVAQPFEDLAPLVDSLRTEPAPPIWTAAVPVHVEQGPSRATSSRAAVSARGAAAAPPYVPDKTRVHTVYMLAAAMAAVSVFCAVPGLRHLNLAEAPDWARFVLLLSALQLVYCAWMASLPDWSTVWVGMVVFAVVSAIYGMGLAIAAATPVDRPVVLELSDVRATAPGWCAAVMLLTGLMTYCCGKVSGGWRRSLAPVRARTTIGNRLAGAG